MAKDPRASRGSVATRVRNRVVSGLVVLVPVAITIFALRFLVGVMAGVLLPVIGPVVDHWPWSWRAALSVALLLSIAYLLGEVAAHVVGRKLLALGEGLVLRVPFVKVIYSASKQVVEALGARRESQFKSVVLIEFPRLGTRSLGFLTGTIERPDEEPWRTVFIPTTPNPTTGFLQLVPASQVLPTEMTVEEAIKTIMSLGVLPPRGLPPSS